MRDSSEISPHAFFIRRVNKKLKMFLEKTKRCSPLGGHLQFRRHLYRKIQLLHIINISPAERKKKLGKPGLNRVPSHHKIPTIIT